MSNIPTLVAPSSRTWLGLAREATTGTAVTPSNTIPLNKSEYDPEDMPKFLEDLAIRGYMTHRYADVLGVEDANFSYGGPVFGDVWGFFLDNVFGDLSTTGSSASSSTTTTESLAVAGTAATIASTSGYTVGATVQIDTGSVSEVVVLTATASSSITFGSNPLRFAHSSGATVAVVSSPFTHTFAVLNQNLGVGGINGAQPPTHTATDFTNLTTTVGARAYPSLCIGTLDLTGNSEALFMGKASGNSWVSAAASTTPTNTTTFTTPLPAWRSTVTIGGTQVNTTGEWSVALKRELGVYWTNQNSQNPYVIARGDLDATGAVKFTVPSDESALLYMLNNTQPTLSIVVNNGLSGASQIQFTITATKCDFVKSKPNRSGVLVGYDNEYRTHANTTDVGGSAGLGQMTIQLINATATY